MNMNAITKLIKSNGPMAAIRKININGSGYPYFRLYFANYNYTLAHRLTRTEIMIQTLTAPGLIKYLLIVYSLLTGFGALTEDM